MKKMTNKTEGFYSLLGQIFGSRQIQRVTGDRFYDDDDKVWYVDSDDLGKVTCVVSVKGNVIKNIYTENANALKEILQELRPLVKQSIVPVVYIDVYQEAGYMIEDAGKSRYVKIGSAESETK